MADGMFTVTAPDGVRTTLGADGRTLLVDAPVRPESLAGPSTPVAPSIPTTPTAPVIPQVHWLVRQDMDFTAASLKSGMKTRLTEDGLVPVKVDGTISPLQAVTTVNAKTLKENSPFTAFSPPGTIAKPYGGSEVGLDVVALGNDIRAYSKTSRTYGSSPTRNCSMKS